MKVLFVVLSLACVLICGAASPANTEEEAQKTTEAAAQKTTESAATAPQTLDVSLPPADFKITAYKGSNGKVQGNHLVIDGSKITLHYTGPSPLVVDYTFLKLDKDTCEIAVDEVNAVQLYANNLKYNNATRQLSLPIRLNDSKVRDTDIKVSETLQFCLQVQAHSYNQQSQRRIKVATMNTRMNLGLNSAFHAAKQAPTAEEAYEEYMLGEPAYESKAKNANNNKNANKDEL
jgi:hypothetical protein